MAALLWHEAAVAAPSAWVRRKPAVSIVGTIEHGFVAGLAGRGARTVIATAMPVRGTVPQLHDGLPPRTEIRSSLVTAISDTDITLISAGCGRAIFRAVGHSLCLKPGYHAVLALGAASDLVLAQLIGDLSSASGKSMGPDFGVCHDPSGCLEDWEPRSVSACDRRAAETVRSIYPDAVRVRFETLDAV
jgi:hypothetical protein